jgi:non-canonical (house-cleaning) NTP pyrophosphatase
LRNICEADFAIGIEIGYELNKNRYSIFCWVSIVDKDNNLFSAQSNVFKLPNFHNSIIMNKESLGDKVRDYLNMQTEEFKKIWAKGIIDRSPFILSAIRSALFYYLSREEYE